ncbi:MAG TPA: VCBS repeat-containing protein, partial [Chloroflexota bacterium]|nr:VCBS repeat-containing protein [Chloroflexota bacterium]
APLVRTSNFNNGTQFADMDGDGYPDLVANSAPVPNCTLTTDENGANVCPANCYLVTPDVDNRQNDYCEGFWGPAVYMNRTQSGQGWKLDTTYGLLFYNQPADLDKRDQILDMNGDGRADYVHFGPGAWEMTVYLNNGVGWTRSDELSFTKVPPVPVDDWPLTEWPMKMDTRVWHFADVNRDGFPDFMLNAEVNDSNDGVIHYSSGSVLMNDGGTWGRINLWSQPSMTSGGTEQRGDVDGDGLHDIVRFFPPTVVKDCPESQCTTPDCKTQQPAPCTLAYVTTRPPNVGFSLGGAYDWLPSDHSFLDSAARFAPTSMSFTDVNQFSDYYFAMADVNGDGLADFILNHEGGGQTLINNGSSWVDLENRTSFSTSPGSGAKVVPVVPTAAEGHHVVAASSIDMNGDGLPDLVQSRFCDYLNPRPAGCQNT